MAVSQDATWQVDENFGFAAFVPTQEAFAPADENVGFVVAVSKDGLWQADENLVITPMINPWTDPMDNFDHWGFPGTWTINPAGVAFQAGDSSSSGTLMRIDTSAYVEADVYMGNSSGNWVMLKLNVTTGANGYANNEGVGIIAYSNPGSVGPYLTNPNPATVAIPLPHSDAASVRIGIHRRSNTLVDMYVNGLKVWSDLVPTQSMSGNRVMLSAYNGVQGRVKSVSFADAPPSLGNSATVFQRIILRRGM